MSNKKKRKYYLYTALGFVTIATFAAVIMAAKKWNQPLFAGVELPTYAFTQTATKPADDSDNTEKTSTPTPMRSADSHQSIESVTTPDVLRFYRSTATPLCGGPPVMTFLAIGVDTMDDDYYYGLADVIRIVRVDFLSPRVTILTLPRDLWVEIPEISDHYGITHGKLNQAYLYGTKGMGYYDGPGQGAGLMALTLAHNFDLFVDHYGVINMATMARIINAVGGIDIYLEEAVDGRVRDQKVDFSAGHNHLTGRNAILFARARQQDSDLNRINRQTQVLYALQEKILSPSILPQIPKLITTFQDAVITDLSLNDIANLTCLVPHITNEKMIIGNLPEHLLEEGRQYDPVRKTNVWAYKPDLDAIRTLIGKFQSGTWPQDVSQVDVNRIE
ncbi:hypothetical protein AMJ86_05340 [bacterium SM23_57]|jgi:LCP family protein required for cell wall assembly|nr:MAG: hypothetical protein AMJ86_05340 [bacterium SM23_57]